MTAGVFLLQVRISARVVKAVDRLRLETGETRADAADRLLRLVLETYCQPSGWPFEHLADTKRTSPPAAEDEALELGETE